jgi:aspartate aminotransferase-like enzyme
MSNYPNMSYCMCENTLMALQQVVNSMQEEGLAFLLELSRDERRAFQELFYTCESFINQAQELENQLQDLEQGFETR